MLVRCRTTNRPSRNNASFAFHLALSSAPRIPARCSAESAPPLASATCATSFSTSRAGTARCTHVTVGGLPRAACPRTPAATTGVHRSPSSPSRKGPSSSLLTVSLYSSPGLFGFGSPIGHPANVASCTDQYPSRGHLRITIRLGTRLPAADAAPATASPRPPLAYGRA